MLAVINVAADHREFVSVEPGERIGWLSPSGHADQAKVSVKIVEVPRCSLSDMVALGYGDDPEVVASIIAAELGMVVDRLVRWPELVPPPGRAYFYPESVGMVFRAANSAAMRLRIIEERQASSWADFLEHGPRMVLSRGWIIAKGDGGKVLYGGLGIFGHGTAWLPETDHSRLDETYAAAPHEPLLVDDFGDTSRSPGDEATKHEAVLGVLERDTEALSRRRWHQG